MHETNEGWHAELALEFERRAARTVLARRRHAGPLQVQKPFYPEGPHSCHGVVLHPPGGIVAGDELRIEVRVRAHASALLTTPGAGKWYRSRAPGLQARHALRAHVAGGAAFEWLPQPTIVFDGAAGTAETDVDVEPGGCYIGWEIVCLGRTAAGERFRDGELWMSSRMRRAHEPLWLERARLEGGSRLLDAPAGLDAQPVCGTFVAVADAGRMNEALQAGLLAACRAEAPRRGRGGITRLPEVLVARYLGDRAEAAHEYFASLWRHVRPALTGREAVPPRIWRT